jgi:hypothetical protein
LLLQESEAPDDSHIHAMYSVPLCAKSTAEAPLRILRDACVTMEDEEQLRQALGAVARALGGGVVVKDVGKVVDQLPAIQ